MKTLNLTKRKVEFSKRTLEWMNQFHKTKTWFFWCKNSTKSNCSKIQTWILKNARLSFIKLKLDSFDANLIWILNFMKSSYATWVLYKHISPDIIPLRHFCDHVKRSTGKIAWWMQKQSFHRFGECVGYTREASSNNCGNYGFIARCHVSKLWLLSSDILNQYFFERNFYLSTKNRG